MIRFFRWCELGDYHVVQAMVSPGVDQLDSAQRMPRFIGPLAIFECASKAKTAHPEIMPDFPERKSELVR